MDERLLDLYDVELRHLRERLPNSAGAPQDRGTALARPGRRRRFVRIPTLSGSWKDLHSWPRASI